MLRRPERKENASQAKVLDLKQHRLVNKSYLPASRTRTVLFIESK